MKIFIVGYIQQLTNNYHPEGGLVVIARDIDHAKALVDAEGPRPTEQEWADTLIYSIQDDAVPAVFVYPDAGCC